MRLFAIVAIAALFHGTMCCRTASAFASEAQIQTAIQRGVAVLKVRYKSMQQGYQGLAAYALLKAGERADSPAVAEILEAIVAKITTAGYKPRSHHIYEAGIDLMALEAADGVRFRTEIEKIAEFILLYQGPNGQWDYPNNISGGDTSISQYALLGLWAAARAGVDIPKDVWLRAALWHFTYQSRNGGFSYHPVKQGGSSPLHSMTAAGTGSLFVIKLFVDVPRKRTVVAPPDNSGLARLEDDGEPKKRVSRFTTYGVLELIDFENVIPGKTSEEKRAEEKPVAGPAVPRITHQDLELRTKLGMGWMTQNFTISKPTGWPIYYLYTLERLGALSGQTMIGDHDWYAEGADYLVRMQKPDGVWKGNNDYANVTSTTTPGSGTCFAILFLAKATAKLVHPIKRRPGPAMVGEGLLAGGRGLPDDLTRVDARDGKVEARDVSTSLDQLLAELSNPQALEIEATQEALVKTVQVGDREELIGKKDRLVELAKVPQAEIRRTAFWALGRCEDIRLAPLLIAGLEDPDIDVMVEARNALCTLSRMPRGFGLSSSPLASLPEDVSDGERAKAVAKWRQQALKHWRNWYLQVRPYDERDDLFQGNSK